MYSALLGLVKHVFTWLLGSQAVDVIRTVPHIPKPEIFGFVASAFSTPQIKQRPINKLRLYKHEII